MKHRTPLPYYIPTSTLYMLVHYTLYTYTMHTLLLILTHGGQGQPSHDPDTSICVATLSLEHESDERGCVVYFELGSVEQYSKCRKISNITIQPVSTKDKRYHYRQSVHRQCSHISSTLRYNTIDYTTYCTYLLHSADNANSPLLSANRLRQLTVCSIRNDSDSFRSV